MSIHHDPIAALKTACRVPPTEAEFAMFVQLAANTLAAPAAPTVSDCPSCSGNGDEARHSPCRACGGAALITCDCGNCEAGLVLVGEDEYEACATARPLTAAEVNAHHDAFIAERGPVPAEFA